MTRKERPVLQWEKTMSRSDAQNETAGSPMPFLRLTKEDLRNDEWPMWFRDTFFRDLNWEPELSKRKHHIEVALVEIHVVILGSNLGLHVFKLDHDTEGHTVVLSRDRAGKFRLVIK